ncbi:MAG: hypothetical protein Fur007_10830 [Rhodoferax sp.]
MPVAALVVAVDGVAQAVGAEPFYQPVWSVIMKSIAVFSIALATTLAVAASAYAQGPNNARQGAAAQTRSATGGQAGVGTGTATHAQLHTPGTGLTDPSLAVGRQGSAGTPRGIHTPGTGLAAPAL